jgi:tRNA(adenine34) deaminase
MLSDLDCLKLAIEVSRKAGEDCPIGCVIARNGIVLSARHNEVMASFDPTAHAEMLCIREVSAKLGTRYLTDCVLYCTLEPCPMCMEAINLARVSRVVFGCLRQQKELIYPDMIGGILEKDCSHSLTQFFEVIRSNK